MDSIGEYIVIAVDAVVLGTLNYFYQKHSRKLFNIEKAPEINLSDYKTRKNLPQVIDYAVITGEVQPKANIITSIYTNNFKGVMRLHEIKQHGKRWKEKQNHSEDFTKVITRELHNEPFYLSNKKSNVNVEILNPKQAEFIVNEFETTYYKYDKSRDSILSLLANYVVSNEITTAVEITESMLKTGTLLNAYGRLEKLTDNVYILSEPRHPDYAFILTKQNRVAILDSVRSDHQVFKVFMIIFGTIGVATGVYCLYRIYKKYKKNNNEN